jgi:hypothetical protein
MEEVNGPFSRSISTVANRHGDTAYLPS